MKFSSWTQAVQLRGKTFLLTPKVRCAFINTFAKEVICSARFLKLSAKEKLLACFSWNLVEGCSLCQARTQSIQEWFQITDIMLHFHSHYRAFMLRSYNVGRIWKISSWHGNSNTVGNSMTHNTSSFYRLQLGDMKYMECHNFFERIPHSVLWWNCRVVYLDVLIKICIQWVFFMNTHNLDNMTWWVKHNDILK